MDIEELENMSAAESMADMQEEILIYEFLQKRLQQKLAKWISIPDQIHYDKMHMSDIGTFKTIFNHLFEAKNETYSLSEHKFYTVLGIPNTNFIQLNKSNRI